MSSVMHIREMQVRVRYVPYIPCTNAYYASFGFPPYKWSMFETAPWTPLEKPLDKCRIALLGSGGISLKGQPLYDPYAVDDYSIREIPKDAKAEDFVLKSSYYDQSDAEKDINCVFPIERFRDLEKEGYIGELAPVNITTGMGRLYKRTHLQTVMAPAIAELLKEEKVDAVFLITT